MSEGSGGVESEMGISGLWIAVIIGVIILLTVILAFLIRYVYNFGTHLAATFCNILFIISDSVLALC